MFSPPEAERLHQARSSSQSTEEAGTSLKGTVFHQRAAEGLEVSSRWRTGGEGAELHLCRPTQNHKISSANRARYSRHGNKG